mmetsp:Transcript_50865/g.121627  ORF Transcript_50865/g.121627 Transcript_50865/m.121627 type:complete len:204 (-) Transcript_50865:333-944(-)
MTSSVRVAVCRAVSSLTACSSRWICASADSSASNFASLSSSSTLKSLSSLLKTCWTSNSSFLTDRCSSSTSSVECLAAAGASQIRALSLSSSSAAEPFIRDSSSASASQDFFKLSILSKTEANSEATSAFTIARMSSAARSFLARLLTSVGLLSATKSGSFSFASTGVLTPGIGAKDIRMAGGSSLPSLTSSTLLGGFANRVS